ncbi:MAG TPA: hypothetical protein VLL54_11115 [Pyrinomonadaceae bacterium]|nr:hypothetical protein [Pyrinomonadaceae bacterium]
MKAHQARFEIQDKSARGQEGGLAPALLFLPVILLLICLSPAPSPAQQQPSVHPPQPEYLWYEAENMLGFSTKTTGEPMQNPWWLDLPKAKAPGWGMNGPGVSAEWTQGGESEWNSAAASADESSGRIHQDIEIPRAGKYRIWVRYADYANRTENFVIRLTQDTPAQELLHHEFGTRDVIDPHDETSMYWGWAFAWDKAEVDLAEGQVHLWIEIEKAAQARRHVDCVLVTNDLAYVPEGRRKPDFSAARYLREWSTSRAPLTSLVEAAAISVTAPNAWQRQPLAGHDFLMPWNINPEFWKLYDQPVSERPLYPFNAEPIEEFVRKYKGARDVPLFDSKFVVPVIYVNNLAEYFKEGSPFLRYLRETKVPFAILINYGATSFSKEEGPAAWKLLTGEFKDQFLGWISGESVGHVWEQAPTELKISATMSRQELLNAHYDFYTKAIARKWAEIFHVDTGAMWDKLIPAQSTSSTSFAHALTQWGVRLLGVETAAVQPMFAMRTAFTRGAVRQFGGNFLYYHAPNFGDTATTFTRQQNFAGPDNFFHSHYGVTMGPSLSWYRKSYYFYYMSGASAIYLEQGFDQFFKPGPGDHDFQLNPLGRITNEFMQFAERHPNRGTPYTPIAFLLEPAHGWDMTDYPQWPFEVSQINRSDRALRELFGVAYYPGLVLEGEPATGDRQAFVSGIFGDIFDVLVTSDAPTEAQSPKSRVQSKSSEQSSRMVNKSTASNRESKKAGLEYEGSGANDTAISGPSAKPKDATNTPPEHDQPKPKTTTFPASLLDGYRALVAGGHIDWSAQWAQRLTTYVQSGGTVVLNPSQTKGLSAELLGIRLTGETGEAHNVVCLSPGEVAPMLAGQVFRYQRLELKGAVALMKATGGDPLVTVNKVGKGKVVFITVPDLLGEDERMTPFAAHLLAHVFADATPIKVSGDVEYLFNRNENGWVVTLINNNGVFKPQQGMAQVDRSAYVTATMSFPRNSIQKVLDWNEDKGIDVKPGAGQDSITVSIAPGGVSILEFYLAK